MTDYKLSYRKGSAGKAQAFRSRMTDAERKLSSALRNKRIGLHFRRQVPLGRYFCDFLCLRHKLVIEADGSQHYTRKGMVHDTERDDFLHSKGFTVLRFSDKDILINVDGVAKRIKDYIDAGNSNLPHPNRPLQGGGI